MSMSPSPVGGPQPVKNNDNADNAEQTADVEEGTPTAAAEPSGAIGNLPTRNAKASGHRPKGSEAFSSAPPTIDPEVAARGTVREERPALRRPAPLDLRAAFSRKPPESPSETSTEDATTPDTPET